MSLPSCTIIILTYKGRPYLETLLPTVAEAIKNQNVAVIETIILDNAANQDTQRYVNENYPSYNYIAASKNDFLFSYNEIVRKTNTDLVFLLNDDLKLDKDIFNKTIPLLVNDPSLFAVSCTLMDWDGKQVQEAVRTMTISKGWLYHNNIQPDNKIRYTFNACGGASMYRTKMFNELNGFDKELFFPAYYEDTDLSHRAWHKKWRIINNPDALVYHKGSGSWGENKKVDILRERNRIAGMLKNCDTDGFYLQFILMLPLRILKSIFNSYVHTQTFFKIMPLMAKISGTKNNPFPDTEIMKLLGKEYIKPEAN